MTKVYRIAEKNIAITPLYDAAPRMCREYLIPGGRADFSVVTDRADIEFERERSAREDEA
jgi:hypothetical protein